MWQDLKIKYGPVLVHDSVDVLVLKELKVYDKDALARFIG